MEVVGKLDGAIFFAAFVHEHYPISFFQTLENELTFTLFLLCSAERFGIFELGNHFKFKGNVVFDARNIVRDQSIEVGIDGATDKKKVKFQGDVDF